MVVKIIQKEHKEHRAKAPEVLPQEIGTEKINKIIKKMKEALASQDDGVAIAAPQIGESLQIFVVSGRVLNILKKDEETTFPDSVYINPVITKRSREKETMEEGCLSVRWLYGKVKRSKKVHIQALDESGMHISRGGSGLMAQIFQHETDHLNGVLFTDIATDIEEIPPEMIPPQK